MLWKIFQKKKKKILKPENINIKSIFNHRVELISEFKIIIYDAFLRLRIDMKKSNEIEKLMKLQLFVIYSISIFITNFELCKNSILFAYYFFSKFFLFISNFNF